MTSTFAAEYLQCDQYVYSIHYKFKHILLPQIVAFPPSLPRTFVDGRLPGLVLWNLGINPHTSLFITLAGIPCTGFAIAILVW